MKIGIDISQIVYRGTGVARFTEGLVNSILNNDNDNRWTFFFSSFRLSLDRSLESAIKNKGHGLIKLPIPPTGLSYLWNNLHIINADNFAGNLDWFITSDWTEPPTKIKKATIVHDLVFLRYPETVNQTIAQTQTKRLSWVKKESQLIFADSRATKNDLVDHLKVDEGKVVVNYPGVQVDKPDRNMIGATLRKYNMTKPFILTVGKIEPRKNIAKLVEAYKKINNPTIDLVIVGTKGWDNKTIQSIDRLGNNIHFLGFVNDQELYSLYSSCLFFIFPSIWEGFGYPAVEAMSLGTPTALANTSSLKEIGDNASLLFNPHKIDFIKEAMIKLINDEKLRKELSAKGLQQSQLFSWKNYLNKMLKTLQVTR